MCIKHLPRSRNSRKIRHALSLKHLLSWPPRRLTLLFTSGPGRNSGKASTNAAISLTHYRRQISWVSQELEGSFCNL